MYLSETRLREFVLSKNAPEPRPPRGNNIGGIPPSRTRQQTSALRCPPQNSVHIEMKGFSISFLHAPPIRGEFSCSKSVCMVHYKFTVHRSISTWKWLCLCPEGGAQVKIISDSLSYTANSRLARAQKNPFPVARKGGSCTFEYERAGTFRLNLPKGSRPLARPSTGR